MSSIRSQENSQELVCFLLHDTILDLTDTMLDLLDTLVDLPDTMVDLSDTYHGRP